MSPPQPCRNKAKTAVTLSDAEQMRESKDQDFLGLVSLGDITKVKEMIASGQETNVGDENGESACHKAMRVGGDDMLRILVEHGAYADYADIYGKRPIVVGMEGGEPAEGALTFLIGLKADDGSRIVNLTAVNDLSGNSLLHDAAWMGNTAAMKALLATGSFEQEMLEAANKNSQRPMQCVPSPRPRKASKSLRASRCSSSL